MKSIFVFLTALFTIASASASITETIEIAPMKTVKLDYDTYAGQSVKIMNRSNKQVDIAAIDAETGKQVKGFGLAQQASNVLMIDEGLVLTLRNNTASVLLVELKIVKTPKPPRASNDVYITFTMRNSSARSIPLIIPGVMNPNLSPFSTSGVSLKIGQKVLFKHKGRKELLFVVDDRISNGEKVDIAALLKQRKAELNTK